LVKQNNDSLKEKLSKLPIFSSKKTILLTIITFVLLGFVLYKVDFNNFVNAVLYLDVKYFFILLGLSIVEIFLYSERFRMFFDIDRSFKTFFGYLTGYAFGRVVPPRPFGEYLRLLLTKHYFKAKFNVSLLAIIFDNLIDSIAMVIYGIIAAIILADKALLWKLSLMVIISLSVFYIFYFFYTNFTSLKNVFGFNYFYKGADYLKKHLLDQAYQFLTVKKSIIVVGTMLTILCYIVAIAKMYLVLIMLGIHLPLITVAAVWTISHIVGNASMLPGGFGAFEFTFAFLMKDYGIAEPLAITAALIERIFNIWLFAIVGLLYFLYSKIPLKSIQDNFVNNTADYLKDKLGADNEKNK